jgi:hypothetical protein
LRRIDVMMSSIVQLSGKEEANAKTTTLAQPSQALTNTDTHTGSRWGGAFTIAHSASAHVAWAMVLSLCAALLVCLAASPAFLEGLGMVVAIACPAMLLLLQLFYLCLTSTCFASSGDRDGPFDVTVHMRSSVSGAGMPSGDLALRKRAARQVSVALGSVCLDFVYHQFLSKF